MNLFKFWNYFDFGRHPQFHRFFLWIMSITKTYRKSMQTYIDEFLCMENLTKLWRMIRSKNVSNPTQIQNPFFIGIF